MTTKMLKNIVFFILPFAMPNYASTLCMCTGTAELIQSNRDGVTIKILNDTRCYIGFCLKPGKVLSVPFRKSQDDSVTLKRYMSKSAPYLQREKPGYKFGYIYTLRENHNVGEAKWLVQRKSEKEEVSK